MVEYIISNHSPLRNLGHENESERGKERERERSVEAIVEPSVDRMDIRCSVEGHGDDSNDFLRKKKKKEKTKKQKYKKNWKRGN